MQVQLLKAFQVLDSRATMEDVLRACRQLFIESDEYNLSIQHPFDPSEVDAVANAIYDYILINPHDPALREIEFKVARPLEGSSIEYCEYASMFSEDMLYQNDSTDFASLDLDDLRRALKTFLVGILFRYQFCVSEDRAAFSVSKILDYMDSVRILLSREQREGEWSDALRTTLAALGSLEPRYRMEEEASKLAARLDPQSGGQVDRAKLGVEMLLADGIAHTVNKRWQELGITDQVELKVFAALNTLVRTKDAKTVASVCLIKPGSDVPSVRHVTFKDDERVAMRYTCVTARVTDAIAIVNSIDIEGNALSVQEIVLRYTADGVWKPVE